MALSTDYYIPFLLVSSLILFASFWGTLVHKIGCVVVALCPIAVMCLPRFWEEVTVFSIAKLLALLLGTVLVSLARYYKPSAFLRRFVVLAVIINIFEAVLQDLAFPEDVAPVPTSLAKTSYYINALNGLMLIAHTITVWKAMYVREVEVDVDWWPTTTTPVLLWNHSRWWVWAYLTWHSTFIWGFASNFCDEFSIKVVGVYFLSNCAMLMIPTVAEYWMPGIWQQVRAYTLTFFVAACVEPICIYEGSDNSFALVNWYSDVGHITLALIALVTNIIALCVVIALPLYRGEAVMRPDIQDKEDSSESVGLERVGSDA